MLLTGLACVTLIEIYAAVMQREFQHTDNRLGKGFAILGIYFFVIALRGCMEPRSCPQPSARRSWASPVHLTSL
jgi:hypothetical protein